MWKLAPHNCSPPTNQAIQYDEYLSNPILYFKFFTYTPRKPCGTMTAGDALSSSVSKTGSS